LLDTQAGTPTSLDLAKRWIASCFQTHPECQCSADGEDPPLPTRIIDIGGPDQDSVAIIPADGKKGKWLALSHRWPRGPGQIVRLLAENIQIFKAGIPLASLPATFQDAIKLTRFLGLRYLWIDSMCIIQDSVSDWESESAKMPSIYQFAYVTLAAAATEDSQGGLFVERAWAQRSMAFSLPLEKGPITIDLPLSHGLENEEINYLDKRAWCFQESRLSHRLLTFDRLQMSYTCLKHGLQESRVVPEAAACEERNSFLPRLYSASATSSPSQRKTKEFISTWYQAVTDYTSRSLTFPQDKLVAIAGMARIVGSFLNCSYHAGLWEDDLPQALLWSPYEEETFPHPPHKASLTAEYRAPSWSWASVESQISTFLCRQTFGRKAYADILSISTTLQGPDPYGQVKSGHLTIKAPFLKAVVGSMSANWPYQPNAVPSGYDFVQYAWQEEEAKYGHVIFDIGWLGIGTSIWLLKITDGYGLVLVPAEHHEGCYQRIGLVHFVDRVKISTTFEVKIV
jgi:Heterokaryon incompatibility protein (HET)